MTSYQGGQTPVGSATRVGQHRRLQVGPLLQRHTGEGGRFKRLNPRGIIFIPGNENGAFEKGTVLENTGPRPWQRYAVSLPHSVNQRHTYFPTHAQVLHRLKALHY